MGPVNVNDLDLMEGWSEADPTKAGRFEFPIHVGTGAVASSVVYFEVQPGQHCGRHTHSAEEIAYVVSGSGEAELDGKRYPISAGSLVLIPTMAPHDIHATGDQPVKVVGFFAAAAVLTDFEDPIAPLGMTVFTIGQEPEVPVAG